MLTTDQIKEFVKKVLLSGEEIHYVSSIEKPKFALAKFLIGFVLIIVFTGLSTVFLESLDLLKDNNHMQNLSLISGALIGLYMIWAVLFYKVSTRRILTITNLRFIIYEYPHDLHKLTSVEELDNYSNKKEISFDHIESMKLTEGKENQGLLAMVFEQEDETQKAREMAKLHLEIHDCKALREAIPERMRPEGSKEDFWERTYDD